MSGVQVAFPALLLPQTVYQHAHVRASGQAGAGGDEVVADETPTDIDTRRVCAQILCRQLAEVEALLAPDGDLQRRIAAAEGQVRALRQEREKVVQTQTTLRDALRQLDSCLDSPAKRGRAAVPRTGLSYAETNDD
jgi:hypothetical protein